ncbi:hydrogenase expression/formation protein HypE [Helicobacter trogontum]|uniref:Hydrogenase expression/formation protein HypE n=1 Tax=Helicobacter trogontum TaxID=50960 RepID=A0A4U8TBS4_9HELI|nr:hydrogenase expression/formation protein HypE [Helicobacter trogontum]MDY5184827.1 hydrogenase expression/formation protein HypE [Helicobacter trogontum]TLD96668.1 hydrogenase expression/formation protein HypE [Helicobacter trogontum]
MNIVTLAHGSGGINSAEFVQKIFMPYFTDIMPYANEDSGIFCNTSDMSYVTSTDSYTINPIFFAGGDIGKLCVCGSSNDVAMMGGKPLYLNIGFIIEEGFSIDLLKKIAESIAIECKKLDIKILSADTKVLPKVTNNTEAKDKLIFINTTCIGSIQKDSISAKNLSEDDCIILSGKIGNHGAQIFLEQNHIAITSNIQSDCASLYPMLEPLLQSDIPIHCMRDATRGGLSSVLNEWAISSHACIDINEASIQIDSEVYGVCEMLGLEPYDLANEGVCVIALPNRYADKALSILKQHVLGSNAAVIGKVSKVFTPQELNSKAHISGNTYYQKVVLHTKYGSKRFLEYPQGELLPRIC